MKNAVAIRITAGIILIIGGLYFFGLHLLDHAWRDAHFVIGAIVALLGVWLTLSRPSMNNRPR